MPPGPTDPPRGIRTGADLVFFLFWAKGTGQAMLRASYLHFQSPPPLPRSMSDAFQESYPVLSRPFRRCNTDHIYVPFFVPTLALPPPFNVKLGNNPPPPPANTLFFDINPSPMRGLFLAIPPSNGEREVPFLFPPEQCRGPPFFKDCCVEP